MNGVSEDRQGVLGLEIGGELIRAIVDYGQPVSLAELSKISGLSSAKVSRYIISLLRIGLLELNQTTNRYRLGPFALQVGLAAIRGLDLSALAEPVLINLSNQCNQTVALAVWGNGGPVIVRCIEGNDLVSVNIRLGTTLPMIESATGLCFSAFSNAAAVKKALDESIRDYVSDQHISVGMGRSQIIELLREVRTQGLARTSNAIAFGFSGFSAPVFNYAGGMVAAVTVIGSANTLDLNWKGDTAESVRNAARFLSNQLGERRDHVRLLPDLAPISPLTGKADA